MANFAGVDIGGTKIIVAIGDETGRLSSRTRLATAQFAHGLDALDAIADAIQALSEEAGIPMNSLTAIGVGCPGPLKGGQLLKTDNGAAAADCAGEVPQPANVKNPNPLIATILAIFFADAFIIIPPSPLSRCATNPIAKPWNNRGLQRWRSRREKSEDRLTG